MTARDERKKGLTFKIEREGQSESRGGDERAQRHISQSENEETEREKE